MSPESQYIWGTRPEFSESDPDGGKSRQKEPLTLIAIVKVIRWFFQLIVLMESPHRLYNPHLRARLAEGLEALLPTPYESPGPVTMPNLGTFHREQLFITHPHRQQVSRILYRISCMRCMYLQLDISQIALDNCQLAACIREHRDDWAKRAIWTEVQLSPADVHRYGSSMGNSRAP